VTRDRIVGETEAHDGRRVTLVDTGGLLIDEQGGLVPLIRSQAETAIREGDVIMLLLDGETGITPEDLDIATYLRSLDLQVVPTINKGDRKGVELNAQEFHRLGFGDPVVISAEHGTGLDGLWERLEPYLGSLEATEAEDHEVEDEIQVAIIGRPNVGKSSLLNRLVGDPRVVVSEIPGTTRDAVDVVVRRNDMAYRFVDTAGIRRKGRTDRGPEVLSVVMARRHLELADLCLVMVDAVEGITRQDAHIAGYAWEAGRAVGLVVNKWDLVRDREISRRQIDDQVSQGMKFIRHPLITYISALTGKGVQQLFPMMEVLSASHQLRIAASDLNRVVRQAWDRRPPPAAGRKEPKLYYCSQVHKEPPHFLLFTNLKGQPHFSYIRYLENILRDTFGLEGIPIRVMIKGRTK
jgi:GTP-binding protein